MSLAARVRETPVTLWIFCGALALSLVRSVDQPDASFRLAGTTVAVVPADLALLALAVALASRGRGVLAAVRREPALAVAGSAFALWILATAATNGATAFVAAAKLLELALLGLGALVLVDSARRLALVVGVVTALAVAAAAVGMWTYATTGGGRQDSFTGGHDLAALATLPLAYVLASFFARDGWPASVRTAVGIVCGIALALAAALASLLGLYLAAVALWIVAARRGRFTARGFAASLAVVVAVSIAPFYLRNNDLGFIHTLLGKQESRPAEFASSWSQRLIYVYVGGRIFVDRPIAGTGWWGLLPPSEFARYVPDARERFTNQPPNYFPPIGRTFIPQQTYDEVLYELGLVGAALAVALLVAAGRASLRTLRDGAATALAYVPLLWFATLLGAIAGEGLFGGSPLAALFWLSLGLTGAAAASTRGADA